MYIYVHTRNSATKFLFDYLKCFKEIEKKVITFIQSKYFNQNVSSKYKFTYTGQASKQT